MKLKHLFIIMAVLVISVASSLFILSNHKKAIEEAEANTPENAIISVIENIQNGNMDDICEYYTEKSSFNTIADLKQYLTDTYNNVDVNNLKVVKNDDDSYNLIEDNKLISTIQLIQYNNTNIITSSLKGDVSVKVEVPAGESLYVNGVKADTSYRTSSNVDCSYFTDINTRTNTPKVDVYEINDLMHEPELSLSTSASASIKNVLDNTYYVGLVSNEAVDATIISAAQAIAKYPAQDGSLGSVAACTLTDSDLYSRISTLQNQWFTVHGVTNISNAEVTNIVWLSEDSFICNMIMDYYISNGTLERTYYIGYQMSFLKENGSYKVAGFAIDNDMNPGNN